MNFKQYVEEETKSGPVDIIAMDVPLFIRLLEYAREDAKTDMDLHKVAEKAVLACKEQSLSMHDYNKLVS